MADLADGESRQVEGNHGTYTIKYTGGVYSCTCPAWRNQHEPVERRTCKHLKEFRGEQAEADRIARAYERAGVEFPAGQSSKSKVAKPAKAIVWKPMLAGNWSPDVDPASWWMSEKLDGVRAYWDGKTLWSRDNNKFYAPAWFVENFPPFPLDGELFGGRGKFQSTVSTVRRQDAGDQWKDIKYVIFGSPEDGLAFEDGLGKIDNWCKTHDVPRLQILPQVVCSGHEHLQKMLVDVVENGGEGVMLRKGGSHYEHKRSSLLLKVKVRIDAEARVTGHTNGTGKYAGGMLGALEVVTPDGIEFNIGTGLSDEDRRNPPAIGSIVTYSYVKLSDDGKPVPATFVRVREDVTWDELVAENGGKSKVDPVRLPASKVQRKKVVAKQEPIPQNSPAPPASTSAAERYEYVNPAENSAKFWEVSVSGPVATIRYGRIGTEGKSVPKEFPTPGEAEKFTGKKRAEKLREGYQKV